VYALIVRFKVSCTITYKNELPLLPIGALPIEKPPIIDLT
jgi:hypothetical protein